MSDPALEAVRAAVQRDLAGRGLDRDPQANLFAHCAGDFAEACRGLASHPSAESDEPSESRPTLADHRSRYRRSICHQEKTAVQFPQTLN